MRSLPWRPRRRSGRITATRRAALAGAAKTLSATYEFPIAKHAPIGPTAAVADVPERRDGVGLRPQREPAGDADGDRADAQHLARQRHHPQLRRLGPLRPLERREHGRRGRGGHPLAGVGKPVRLQWMRWDDMQWSTQHAPQPLDISGRPGCARQPGRLHRRTTTSPVGRTIGRSARSLAGLPTMAAAGKHDPAAGELHPVHRAGACRTRGPTTSAERARAGVSAPTSWARPHRCRTSITQIGLRTHSMRTPGQRQQNFAREAFMNELAAAAGMDPFEFRLNNTNDPRMISVDQRGQGGVGLGDAAVAEQDGRHDRLDAARRSGLQRDDPSAPTGPASPR